MCGKGVGKKLFWSFKNCEMRVIKDGTFALPGRKSLLKDDSEYEFLLIDATESPIERPKKTASVLFREEKTTHLKNISRD